MKRFVFTLLVVSSALLPLPAQADWLQDQLSKPNFMYLYSICTKVDGDCMPIAVFSDFESCISLTRRNAWRCNELDMGNISCEMPSTSTVVSQCTKLKKGFNLPRE